MGEHGAMSCTARVYVAGGLGGSHGDLCLDLSIYFILIVSLQILTTATTRAGWATWRGWSCGPRATRARPRRGTCALTPFTRQVDIDKPAVILSYIIKQVSDTVQMLNLLAGNLGRVDFINDYEYDLFVRPDTCNPRYRYLLVRLP